MRRSADPVAQAVRRHHDGRAAVIQLVDRDSQQFIFLGTKGSRFLFDLGEADRFAA